MVFTLGNRAFDKEHNGFSYQIDDQDKQGYQCRTFDKGLGLQLRDQEGQRHGAEVHQEGDCRDGDHSIHEEITVHFHNGGLGAWDIHREEHLEPADTKSLGDIFQIGIKLGKGIVGKQIGGGEEVDNVDQYWDKDGGVKGHVLKGKRKGKT